MKDSKELKPCKAQGRKPTTGKFDTQIELIDKLHALVVKRNMSKCSVARICGVSSVTATKLLKTGGT